MSKTTKSPKKVAAAAYHIARNTLPEHFSRYSPKKFTQHQLFVCLVLKTFFCTDYRGIVQILNDCHDLCKSFDLKTVPHFTTLHKASKRLMAQQTAKKFIAVTIKIALGKNKKVKLAAVDSTGLQTGHISPYFLKRRSNSKKQPINSKMSKWPKMAVISDISNHIILAVHSERGPRSDCGHFKKILCKLPQDIKIEHLLADAGYDSEKNHQYAREELGLKTTIPPLVGNKSNKPFRGKYRRLMQEHFDKVSYCQRWQVETVMSMIKRNLGDSLSSKRYWAQQREMNLLALTHNIMIILFFYLSKSFSTEHKYSIECPLPGEFTLSLPK